MRHKWNELIGEAGRMLFSKNIYRMLKLTTSECFSITLQREGGKSRNTWNTAFHGNGNIISFYKGEFVKANQMREHEVI